jgi:hypothetical protein
MVPWWLLHSGSRPSVRGGVGRRAVGCAASGEAVGLQGGEWVAFVEWQHEGFGAAVSCGGVACVKRWVRVMLEVELEWQHEGVGAAVSVWCVFRGESSDL